MHSLIMLYRAATSTPTTVDEGLYKEDLIQQYTKEILERVDEIPEKNYYHNIFATPLFTAGSQLRSEDAAQ
jgi:Fungal specific transcription factor domain